MDAFEAILTRRSIRRYTTRSISDDLIAKMLEAAMSAPSAGNEQPWHFVVITDRKVLGQVPDFHPHSHMLKESSLGILVAYDVELESMKGGAILDCSAATQNMLLAAHSLGLGAVWLCIYPVEERMTGIRKLLNMPQHVVPVSLVSIGYPNEKPARQERFKAERVHYDHWMSNHHRIIKKEK
jgi:nitroreductase